jgi:DNA-binding CsgD family transcriptional regulator
MTVFLVNDFGDSTVESARFGTKIIEATADWIDALQGGMSFRDALESLVVGLGAEAGMLVRTDAAVGRAIALATVDRRQATSTCPLAASFADGCFGPAIQRPRAASLWLVSALDEVTDEAGRALLEAWQAGRGLSEFTVLVLECGARHRDHIELHFADRIGGGVQAALAALLPTMARTWSQRPVGLVARMAPSRRLAARAPEAPAGRPLLDISNPARLSRAEFRVCLLLSQGLSVAGVSADLGLSNATVRTHLRSIYAKSGASGLNELMLRLLHPGTGIRSLTRLSA